METNNISQITDNQTMTSLQIAELLGRQHGHVLRDIRIMETAWEKVAQSKFGLSSYKDKSGKMVPMFVLTKTECLFVATKFNDEARAKLVLRWEQLEKERLQQPLQPDVSTQASTTLPADPRSLTRLQILQMALQAEEENERLRIEKKELEDDRAAMQDNIRGLEADNYGLMIDNEQKDQQIRQLTEKTAYLGVIMADSSTVTISQVAQDYGQSAVAFNKLLNGLRIQRRIGEQWILYSEFLNKGYVATRMIPIHHADGPDTHKPMTAWTQAGRRFLYERLKKHGILPLIERQAAAEGQKT